MDVKSFVMLYALLLLHFPPLCFHDQINTQQMNTDFHIFCNYIPSIPVSALHLSALNLFLCPLKCQNLTLNF